MSIACGWQLRGAQLNPCCPSACPPDRPPARPPAPWPTHLPLHVTVGAMPHSCSRMPCSCAAVALVAARGLNPPLTSADCNAGGRAGGARQMTRPAGGCLKSGGAHAAAAAAADAAAAAAAADAAAAGAVAAAAASGAHVDVELFIQRQCSPKVGGLVRQQGERAGAVLGPFCGPEPLIGACRAVAGQRQRDAGRRGGEGGGFQCRALRQACRRAAAGRQCRQRQAAAGKGDLPVKLRHSQDIGFSTWAGRLCRQAGSQAGRQAGGAR